MLDLPSSPHRALLSLAGALTLAAAISACGGTTPSAPSGLAAAIAPAAAPPAVEQASPAPADVGATDPAPSADPSTTASPSPAPAMPPATPFATRFPGGLLIADRGNGRILAVDGAGRILWRFPVAGSLPAGQRFSADDAFISPDGRTIVANDEQHQVIDRIDIATRRVVWQYGHYAQAGSLAGYLHNPDDAYPLANGDIMVADIVNCRIIEIAPSKRIVRMLGRTGVCTARAPYAYNQPNGDTPLPDGGVLITEIRGSRVVRLSATGRVLFDIHVPARYPSDAQLDAHGNVVVADYSNPGAVMAVSPAGSVLWRYAPTSGRGRLDHPSLATPLADGTVAVNDDFRQRIVVIDPRTLRIVWQYGRTDVAGRAAGDLFIPDGHQPLPPGTAF